MPKFARVKFSRWRQELDDISDDVGMLEQLSGCLIRLHELVGPKGSHYLRVWATRGQGQSIAMGLRRHVVMPKKDHDVTMAGLLASMIERGSCRTILAGVSVADLAQRLDCAEGEVHGQLRARLNRDRESLAKAGADAKILADRVAHLRLGNRTSPAPTVKVTQAQAAIESLRTMVDFYQGLLFGKRARSVPSRARFIDRFGLELEALLEGKSVEELP